MTAGIGRWASMMKTPLKVRNTPSTHARSMFGVQTVSTAATTYMAHIVEVNGQRRSLTGFDGYCSSVAWIASTSTGNMSADSVIEFPDGTTPSINVFTYVRDRNGNVHHTKVAFG